MQSDLLFQTTGYNCCLNLSSILTVRGGEHYGFDNPHTRYYFSRSTVLK